MTLLSCIKPMMMVWNYIKKTKLVEKIFNCTFLCTSKITLDADVYTCNFEENSVSKRIDYFCLKINNNSNEDLCILKHSIFINKENFRGDILVKNKKIEETEFYLKKYETLFIPFVSVSGGNNFLLAQKNSSLLFFPDKAISLTIEINRKIREFGIDRTKVYKIYINYLTSLFGIVPWNLPNKL